MTLSVCSWTWPKCGHVNPFPGFSQMMAFTCQECGAGVTLPNRLDDDGAIKRTHADARTTPTGIYPRYNMPYADHGLRHQRRSR